MVSDLFGVVGFFELELKVVSFAVLQFLSGVHTTLFEQVGHLSANAIEAHQVGAIDPLRHQTPLNADFLRQRGTLL